MVLFVILNGVGLPAPPPPPPLGAKVMLLIMLTTGAVSVPVFLSVSFDDSDLVSDHGPVLIWSLHQRPSLLQLLRSSCDYSKSVIVSDIHFTNCRVTLLIWPGATVRQALCVCKCLCVSVCVVMVSSSGFCLRSDYHNLQETGP